MVKVALPGTEWGAVTFEMDMRGNDTFLVAAIERQLPDAYWDIKDEMTADLSERQADRVHWVRTELASIGPRPL